MVYIGVPQLLFLALIVSGLTIDATKHGKPYTKTENVWVSLLAALILLGLLYWGGFFTLERAA